MLNGNSSRCHCHLDLSVCSVHLVKDGLNSEASRNYWFHISFLDSDNSVRSFCNILPLVQIIEHTPSLPRPCLPASSGSGGRLAATGGGLTTTVTTMETAQSQNVSPVSRLPSRNLACYFLDHGFMVLISWYREAQQQIWSMGNKPCFFALVLAAAAHAMSLFSTWTLNQ